MLVSDVIFARAIAFYYNSIISQNNDAQAIATAARELIITIVWSKCVMSEQQYYFVCVTGNNDHPHTTHDLRGGGDRHKQDYNR